MLYEVITHLDDVGAGGVGLEADGVELEALAGRGVLPPGDVLRCALALARNEREASYNFV